MPIVTLLSKTHNSFQLKLVDNLLRSTLKGLQVESRICGTNTRGWIQVAVSGEDEKVALHYLADEIGLGPTNPRDIKRFSTIKGCIVNIDESRAELHLDIGASSPENIDVTISLQCLQAQLADGKEVSIKRLAELFGFCKKLPLTIKILNIDYDKNHADAMLSEKQVNRYRNWTESLLDRLIILGSSAQEVRSTFRKAGLNRDILDIEPLGLFEVAAACKLGTDAEGLIPRIGRNLRSATFMVFNPKRVLEFLDYSAAFIFQ